MNQRMTITKNDFFTANNFKTLQDIGKKYPEWKDFCMEIVNQFDDKFVMTQINETSKDIKKLLFADKYMIQNENISEAQEGNLYLIKQHILRKESDQVLSSELYNTKVYLGEPSTFSYSGRTIIEGQTCYIMTIKSDDNYNIGDTLISFESRLNNEAHNGIRYDYNGVLYKVVKVEDTKVYITTEEDVNTPTPAVTQFYLYKKAK